MEPTKYKKCPNCDASIKETLLSINQLVDIATSKFINSLTENKTERHCSKCYYDLYIEAKNTIDNRKEKLRKLIEKSIKYIPILTIPSPHNWDYLTREIVTAQSTTGTGVFSEISSSFTDLFGMQSGAFNSKLKQGEQLCFSQLRLSAASMYCNAIISTDIDYADVGTGKGMLMVCAAGTAVYLNNFEEIYGPEKRKAITTLFDAIEELAKIKKEEHEFLYNPTAHPTVEI